MALSSRSNLLRRKDGGWLLLPFFASQNGQYQGPGDVSMDSIRDGRPTGTLIRSERACQFSCQIGGGYFFTSARILA